MIRSHRAERGITLMEVMVTMTIVSIGILGVTSMNVQSAQAVQNAAEIALATNLATAALDELQVDDFMSITVGSVDGFPLYYDKFGRDVLPADVANRFFSVSANVEGVSTLWKDILVSVSWTDSTKQARARQVQLRGRIRQLARGS